VRYKNSSKQFSWAKSLYVYWHNLNAGYVRKCSRI
jgi:hypothetical protein